MFQRDFTVRVAAVDGSRAPAIEASAGGDETHGHSWSFKAKGGK